MYTKFLDESPKQMGHVGPDQNQLYVDNWGKGQYTKGTPREICARLTVKIKLSLETILNGRDPSISQSRKPWEPT